MSLIAFVGMSLIWTGLLAGCAELLTRGAASPRFARLVWRFAAGLMILPWLTAAAAYVWPSAMAELPVPDIPDFGFVGAGAETPDTVAGVSEWPVTVGTLVLGALCAGWVFRAVCAVRAQVRLQRLKSEAKRVSDPQIRALADTYAHDLGLSQTPEVCTLAALASPFAAGLSARRVYLPEHLLGSGDEPMIVAHECLHIAAGDLVSRPFERLVADILWFSPFAWIARRRLDYLREAVCDAATIELTGDRKAYARALVNVARAETAFVPLPVASLILNDRGSLKRRVHTLMNDKSGKPARLGLIAAASLIIALPLAVAQGVKAAGPSDVFTHPIVMNGRITSAYGERTDPFTKEKKWHLGVDIGGKEGEPVMTPAPGKVIFADYKDGYGKTVVVELADGRTLLFSQLQKIKTKKGDMLDAGGYVGLLGKSGRSTGPHVHFEVRKPIPSPKPGEPKYMQTDPERLDIDLIAG